MSDQTQHRDLVIAGALVRRHLRTFLDLQGITWRERKGLLDSDFIITATPDEWRLINRWIAQAKVEQ